MGPLQEGGAIVIQSSLLTFEDIIPQEQHKSHQVPEKEELTVKLSTEALSAIKNEESRNKELGKLRKRCEDFRTLIKTSTNGREIIFAVKYVESLRPQIERMEREVKNGGD